MSDHTLDQTQEFAVPGLLNRRQTDGYDAIGFTQPFNVRSTDDQEADEFSMPTEGDLSTTVVDSTQSFDVHCGDTPTLTSAACAFLNSTQAFEPTPMDGEVATNFAPPLPLNEQRLLQPSLEFSENFDVEKLTTTGRRNFEPSDENSSAHGAHRSPTPSPLYDDEILDSTQNIPCAYVGAGPNFDYAGQQLAPQQIQQIKEKEPSDFETVTSSKRNRISSSDEEVEAQTDDIRSIASLSPTSYNDGVAAATSGAKDDAELSTWLPAVGSRLRRVSSSSDQIDAADASTSRRSPEEGSTAEEPNEAQQDDDGDIDTDKKSEVGELIADIFGESDDDLAANDQNENDTLDDDAGHPRQHSDDGEREKSDEDEQSGAYREQADFVSDFDLMTQKRKAQNRVHRRRKRDFDFINNNDDMINDLLSQMKLAAKEDIDLNCLKQPATRKRALLPVVAKELKKADLVSTFIECGVVGAMAEWLSLLPDKSLPSLEIRTAFLKILQLFPTLDHQILRSSGIGKSVMLLFKHPKETKENKECAQKLINEWARPIFNLQTDYRSLSKDERTKRDYDHMSSAKKRRLSVDNEKPASTKPSQEEKTLGPGDKGFIGRARVPRPSTKDYVVRPKWNVDTEIRVAIGKKQTTSRMDKKIREIKTRTAINKSTHAVAVSIQGSRMAI